MVPLESNALGELCQAMTKLTTAANALEAMPAALQGTIVAQGLPEGCSPSDFTEMMAIWANVEDQPDVVNSDIDEEIDALMAPAMSSLALVPAPAPAAPPSARPEPPPTDAVQQALATLLDYARSTAGGEDTETLALRLAHRIQNDSVAKKAAAATTQPSLRALVRQQPAQLAPAGDSILRFFERGFGASASS